jgi:Integrase core domain
MDMHSREQYLETLREEYRRASKQEKSRLLNEAGRRTRLNRKVLIRKLAHPRPVGERRRARRKASYGSEVVSALVVVWELFDYPCGQRLVAALREHTDRLRGNGELRCSDQVSERLKKVSPATIDRLLKRERQVRRLRRNRSPGVLPLLYQKVPVKVASEWDTGEVGNLQVDFVEHCGRSTAGEYVHTLSAVDIASSWWEAEAIPTRSQQATQEGLDRIRKRAPFRFREIHPDNDRRLVNDLLWRYCRRRNIRMSRSRPYKKNDNAWVEQRNWTHVRKEVGYRRLDTTAELDLLHRLYGQLRLYKNFFQPVMKLKHKVREGGRIHRRYDTPQTPYQRLMESGQLSASAQAKLKHQYEGLRVSTLRRSIERLRGQLFDLVESKDETGLRKRRRGRPIRAAWTRKRATQNP